MHRVGFYISIKYTYNAFTNSQGIISDQIFMQFYQDIWTHCKKCEVIPAPFCVILSRADGVVVQPDLSVVCRRELLRGGGCEGAPDLVVEILSPGNKKYDCLEKLGIYSKYDVREYWIIDPEQENIMMYDLEEGMSPVVKPFREKMASRVIKGLTLNLGKLLAEHDAMFE